MSNPQAGARPLRLVFAGTPEFAVPCLAACQTSGIDVVAVYTQPDRPAGRGRRLTPSPVKQAALAAGIRVEQPEALKLAAAQHTLAACQPDLLVVVAYGLILPRAVLAAIIIVPVLNLVDLQVFKKLWHASKDDGIIALLTFVVLSDGNAQRLIYHDPANGKAVEIPLGRAYRADGSPGDATHGH